MKNLILCFAVVAFFTSCSVNDEVPSGNTEQIDDGISARFGDTLPQNSDNDFDIAGKIHNELVNAYYGQSNFPSTTSGISLVVDSLASLNTNFVSIRGIGYSQVPVLRVEYLLTNRDSCVTRVLNSSRLSLYARSSFKEFIGELGVLIDGGSNYVSAYNFISSFEAEVLSDTLLTAHDKEVILTTTSIARYTVYMKRKKPKKNEDPDWYWLIANIVAGADGADIGMAEAISRAVVTGIVDNK